MPVALPESFSALDDLSHVALAVSGGSDSVALMRHAAGWVRQRLHAPRLSVLTVDHGLRPEAAGEARQVAAWAANLGLPHRTLAWAGPRPRSAVQVKAREARYDLMTEWCRANGAEALLTAHTFDDQAETVLMRLARTDSVDSLSGIPPRGQWNGLPVMRPLLGIRRDTLRQDLRAWQQDWIEDPSNRDERFERVRIRGALKTLRAKGFDDARLVRLADACRELSVLLLAAAEGFISSRLVIHPRGFGTFDLASFSGLPREVRVRVLRQVLMLFGSGKTPLRAELERLDGDLAHPRARRTLAGAVVWRRIGEVLVAREAGRVAAEPVPVPDDGRLVWDGRFVLDAPPGWRVVPGRMVPQSPRVDGIPRLVHDAEPVVLGPVGEPVLVDFGDAETGPSPVRARFRVLKVR